MHPINGLRIVLLLLYILSTAKTIRAIVIKFDDNMIYYIYYYISASLSLSQSPFSRCITKILIISSEFFKLEHSI